MSTGTIGSPQLLLLSGIGEREHLENLGIPVIHHLPGVGYNLQDHAGSYGLTWTTNFRDPFLYTVFRTYIVWKLYNTGKISIFMTMGMENFSKFDKRRAFDKTVGPSKKNKINKLRARGHEFY